MLKRVYPPSPSKGKKHGQKKLDIKLKVVTPVLNVVSYSHLILVYTFWNSTREEIGCHNSSFHVKLHG